MNQALELRVQERTAELHESEERFRSLSNASLEGIMIYNQGVILDANLAFARLFGYEQPEELIGTNGLEYLLSPESRASIHEQMQRKETAPLEVTGIRKDGTAFAAETDSRLVKYLGHDASIVSCRDITDRKRAQEERGSVPSNSCARSLHVCRVSGRRKGREWRARSMINWARP